MKKYIIKLKMGNEFPVFGLSLTDAIYQRGISYNDILRWHYAVLTINEKGE